MATPFDIRLAEAVISAAIATEEEKDNDPQTAVIAAAVV